MDQDGRNAPRRIKGDRTLDGAATWFRLSVAGALAIAMLLGFGGVYHRNKRDDTKRVEVRSIDLGFVPPEGSSVKVPLRNPGRTAVRINAVRSSCGCTVATAPESIPVHGVAVVEVKVRGGLQPEQRKSRLLVEYACGGSAAVDLAYYTGRVPSFEPRRVALLEQGDGQYVGEAVLWVYSDCSDSDVTVGLAEESRGVLQLALRTLPGHDPSLRLRLPRGLHAVRCSISSLYLQAGAHHVGVVEVVVNGTPYVVPLEVVASQPTIVEVRPREAAIAASTRDEMVGARRVFLITAKDVAQCKVTSKLSFLHTFLTPIGTRQWRLETEVISLIPPDIFDATVTVEVTAGHKTSAAHAKICFRDVRP